MEDYKELVRQPGLTRVYSLFLRQCKVYQQARSQRKKGAKKKRGLVVKVSTNITAGVSQSWLAVDF
jgi:hypothetical protein